MSSTRGRHLIGEEIGSCVLEQLLGYGGSSAVFLARQRSPQEIVAVKVFLPRSMLKQTQKAFYERFLHEAEAASQLDHPNILSIYSYGEENGLPYIVMPYVPGGTLSEYVNRHGPLSLNEAQWYLEDISSALDYAHERGCVHCDVKPANILLDGQGHVLLSDFGIARLTQSDSSAAQKDGKDAKSAETLMGTPDYISPEQALGQPLDGRSDIYSLGVTLYFLLAGHPPFKADSSIAMALQHVHETPPSLCLVRADVTPEIDRVILKALAKWPKERYQTASEFSAAFAGAILDSAQSGTFNDKSSARRARALPFSKNGASSSRRPASRPEILVKPVGQTSFRLSRIMLAVLLLLILIVGSAVTAAVITSRIGSHAQAPIASPTPTAQKVIADHLLDDQLAWFTGSTPDGSYFFSSDGRYYIRNNSKSDAALALYEDYQYSQLKNFSITVKMSAIQGAKGNAGYYGVIFRTSPDQKRYYLFEINTSDGGQYVFYRFDGHSPYSRLAWGSAPSLALNLKQSNTITIVARGNTFTFSINGKPLGDAFTDPSKSPLISGQIGLYVEDQNAEVAFSDLQIDPS